MNTQKTIGMAYQFSVPNLPGMSNNQNSWSMVSYNLIAFHASQLFMTISVVACAIKEHGLCGDLSISLLTML